MNKYLRRLTYIAILVLVAVTISYASDSINTNKVDMQKLRALYPNIQVCY